MFPNPASNNTKRHRGVAASAAPRPFPLLLTLISTNDLHSHCHRYEALARRVQSEVANNTTTLWVDAGDWFSGTCYSCLGPNITLQAVAPEVEFFKQHDIVAAIGNHEFDAQCEGFIVMLEKARAMNYMQFVSTDLEFDAQHDNGQRGLDVLSEDFNKPNVLNRAILRRIQNVVVGIVSFMSTDARRGCAASMQGGGISFTPWPMAKRRGRELVAQLRASGAHLVLVLMHGGSHDSLELKNAIGADFVVSGHTHERLVPTATCPVVQAESYGSAFGVCELDPFALSANVLVSAKIVPVRYPSGPGVFSSHPSFKTSLVPLFANQYGVDLTQSISLARLPPDAAAPIGRRENDPFARWFCTVIRDELNEMLVAQKGSAGGDARPPRKLDGFFIANELIRGDLSKSVSHGVTDLPQLMSCFEVGMTRPTRVGVDVVVLETTRSALKRLWLMFYLASRLYTENAVPAYSEDFFVAPSTSTGGNNNSDVCYVATTLFMAKSMELVPGFIFDAKRRVHTWEGVVLSVLVGRALLKYS